MSNVLVKIVPSEEGVKITLISIANGDRYSITTVKDDDENKKNVITRVKVGKYRVDYPKSYFGPNIITIEEEQEYHLTVVHQINCIYTIDYNDWNDIKISCDTLQSLPKPFSDEWNSSPIFNEIIPVELCQGKEICSFQKESVGSTNSDLMIRINRFGIGINLRSKIITLTNISGMKGINYDAFGDSDCIYVGAYSGHINKEGILDSKNKLLPTTNKTAIEFENSAQLKGNNYHIMSYLQLVSLQLLFIIMAQGYKANGYSNGIIGNKKYSNIQDNFYMTGYDIPYYKYKNYKVDNGIKERDNNFWSNALNWKPCTNMYKLTSAPNQHSHFFGLEDFWGNTWEFVRNGSYNYRKMPVPAFITSFDQKDCQLDEKHSIAYGGCVGMGNFSSPLLLSTNSLNYKSPLIGARLVYMPGKPKETIKDNE